MKRFYDWFHRFYGLIDANLSPSLDKAMNALDPDATRYTKDTVLEWACGSGGLSYKLLPRVGKFEGRDQSEGMLGRAKARWDRYVGAERCRYEGAPFFQGDMVCGPEAGAEWDWIFMSFSLHLFDAETELKILARSLSHARKGVVVIDHEQRWQPFVALVEHLEGSHYDQFLKLDFDEVSRFLAVSHKVYAVPGLTVVEFEKSPGEVSGAP
jgi:SAM-dependent methyltransferase